MGNTYIVLQVTLLLRRMLPEVAPLTLAQLTCVPRLPPTDFSAATTSKGADDEFDPHRYDLCMFSWHTLKTISVSMHLI